MEQFSFTTDEYSAGLTEQSHQTLYWLNRNGYLSAEQTIDLCGRLIVVPIRNHKNFGQRILERFFGKDSHKNSYVFPLTLLEDVYSDSVDSGGKPNLKVVK